MGRGIGGIGVTGGTSRILKFWVKVIYMMGKALLGNLSYMGTGLVLFDMYFDLI